MAGKVEQQRIYDQAENDQEGMKRIACRRFRYGTPTRCMDAGGQPDGRRRNRACSTRTDFLQRPHRRRRGTLTSRAASTIAKTTTSTTVGRHRQATSGSTRHRAGRGGQGPRRRRRRSDGGHRRVPAAWRRAWRGREPSLVKVAKPGPRSALRRSGDRRFGTIATMAEVGASALCIEANMHRDVRCRSSFASRRRTRRAHRGGRPLRQD